MASSMVVGQTENVEVKVPEEVLSFFGQFIGEWRMEGKAFGEAMTGTNTWKWAAGNHCLT